MFFFCLSAGRGDFSQSSPAGSETRQNNVTSFVNNNNNNNNNLDEEDQRDVIKRHHGNHKLALPSNGNDVSLSWQRGATPQPPPDDATTQKASASSPPGSSGSPCSSSRSPVRGDEVGSSTPTRGGGVAGFEVFSSLGHELSPVSTLSGASSPPSSVVRIQVSIHLL